MREYDCDHDQWTTDAHTISAWLLTVHVYIYFIVEHDIIMHPLFLPLYLHTGIIVWAPCPQKNKYNVSFEK